MKITEIHFFKLHGSLDASFRDYERVSRPLDAYAEFDQQGVWQMVDPETDRISVQNIFVEIKTDQGVSGVHGPLVYEALVDIIRRHFAPFLKGRDPLATEALWDQMRKTDRHARTGMMMMAISALDCALWDLKGKVLDQPVYRLLGGASRPNIPVYASTLGYSLEIDKAVAKAEWVRDQGFNAQKWFFRYGPNAGAAGMKKNLELAYALREALGEEYGLMFDCWMGWDVKYALRMVRELEEIRPDWLEEPLIPNDLEGYIRLTAESSIPIAAGEHLYTRWEFKPFLDHEVLEVLQADPVWTGGISELKKIGDMAEVYSVKMIPHGCTVAPAAHVVAALPPSVSPYTEYLIPYQERQQYFQKTPMRPQNGYLELPKVPGLGMDFDEGKIEKYEEL